MIRTIISYNVPSTQGDSQIPLLNAMQYPSKPLKACVRGLLGYCMGTKGRTLPYVCIEIISFTYPSTSAAKRSQVQFQRKVHVLREFP